MFLGDNAVFRHTLVIFLETKVLVSVDRVKNCPEASGNGSAGSRTSK
jgi:hypothetical protein